MDIQVRTPMGERVCPRSEAHDPHDREALFCWVCGRELVCDECKIPVTQHELYRQCPIVIFTMPELPEALKA